MALLLSSLFFLIMMANDSQVRPQAGGQQQFLAKIHVNEVLYGGAAGPGKSWALVYDALGTQYMHTPLGKPAYECSDYRAALFRRKTTQFANLLDEGRKLYIPLGAELVYGRRGDPGPSFNFDGEMVSGQFYTGHKQGARIFICHMENEDNKYDHHGQQYQYAGFDELTQFTVTQYMFLFSRLRSVILYLNARMRATTNPVGSGLIWVKKRFIKTGGHVFKPGDVHWFVADPKREIEDNPTGILKDASEKNARSRMFIPGRLTENLILQESDPDYVLNIMQMGKKYERALKDGDWDAFGGDFFDDHVPAKMALEPFDIPAGWRLIGSLDPGWSSPCSFGLSASDYDGNIFRLFTYYVRDMSPQEHAVAIKKMIKSFRWTKGRWPDLIVSGRDAFARKDLHAINASERTFADVFQAEGFSLQPATTDRVLGWMAWRQLMRQMKWMYFKDYNNPLTEEISAAEHDEKNVEDIKGKGNDPKVSDHALDECRYGIMALYTPAEMISSKYPDWYKDYILGYDPDKDDPSNYSASAV